MCTGEVPSARPFAVSRTQTKMTLNEGPHATAIQGPSKCRFSEAPPFGELGNGRNTVSRVLFRRRELTEFYGKLGEFCDPHGEFALAHKS